MIDAHTQLVIEKGEKMNKLLNSSDFKELFVEDFIRLQSEMIATEFHTASEEGRKRMSEKLIAIGILNNYINGTITSSESSKAYIEEMRHFEEEN